MVELVYTLVLEASAARIEGSNPSTRTNKHCTKQWVVQHSSVGRILLVNVVGSSPTVRTAKHWCSWSLQSKLQSSLRYSRQWGTWLSRGKNPNRCRLIWDWSRMNRQRPHKPLEVGLIPIGPTNQLLAVRNNGKLKEILGSSPGAGSYLIFVS